jgi:hypothetical protein
VTFTDAVVDARATGRGFARARHWYDGDLYHMFFLWYDQHINRFYWRGKTDPQGCDLGHIHHRPLPDSEQWATARGDILTVEDVTADDWQMVDLPPGWYERHGNTWKHVP